MTDYIEREAAIAAITSDPPDAHYPHWYADKIKAITAADVATVRHGRWEKNVRGDYSIVCSECGYGFPTDGYAWLECNRRSDEREYCFQITDVKNYCPNCGARMDEEAKHER